MPRPLEPPAEPVSVDVTPYLGAYERASVRLDVLERDGGPTCARRSPGRSPRSCPRPSTSTR